MKTIIISVFISVVLVGGAIIFSQKSGEVTKVLPENNVSIVDGKQIVSITAKGGYLPNVSKAKADIPTTLRIATNATFDCSSTLTIPSMNYQKNLPPSGVTEIELPPQKAGSTFEGLCGMGMYSFEIMFE